MICIKWLVENGHADHTKYDLIALLIDFCTIDDVKWLFNKGFYLNELTFKVAAKAGNLNIMKWLLKNGCRWNKETFDSAAYNGCPWPYAIQYYIGYLENRDINLYNWLKARI